MNDLGLIKEEIFNCGYVPKLLESMGCEINHNTSSNERIEASRPNGNNNRSVQVYLNEYLTSRIRSKAHIPVRDIYDLVSYIKYGKETSKELDDNIPKSKKYIIEVLGLKGFSKTNKQDIKDPNDWLKEIQRKRKKRINLDEIEPNPILPETVLDEFVQAPHELFLLDNINWEIQKEYEIGFDIQSERITIPIRNKDGLLIGVKGRATKKEDEENYKYLPIYSFQKSKELFNLHKALPYIKEQNEIILLESEKSPMKAFQMGVFNTCSQMGSDITKVQAEIIKRLNPDIRIVLAYDKDKSAKEVKQMAKVFGKYDNLYGIIDNKNILEQSKSSPVDEGFEKWNTLYNKCCFKVFTNSK